jgi:hypothetical protein
MTRHWKAAAGLVAILMTGAGPVSAQWWLDVPDGAFPRNSAGEPDLSAPAPRTASGHPDLSGIWGQIKTYSRDLADDLVSPDSVPYQPWSRQLADARADGSHSGEDPPAHCLPQGVPRLGGAPAPWKIIQTDDLIVIIYEAFGFWRQVFMDGRRLADDVNPTWMGYSTGRWDGDTLVIDTRGFNGKAWLDQVGKASTDQLHVIERLTRKDFGHLDTQVTIDDPGAYTAPWTVQQHANLLTGTELLEFICNENNVDVGHLPTGGSLEFD